MNPIQCHSLMDIVLVQVVPSNPKWKITVPHITLPPPLDTLQHPEKPVVLGRARVCGTRTLATAKSREDAQRAQFPQDSAILSGSACPERMFAMALAIGVLLALLGCTATEG